MSNGETDGKSEAVSFEKVQESELKTIEEQRASDGEKTKEPLQLAGLAFSGGGIRSAVFNLGFIQGLANRNSLHVFDYLSTVSGGGYIGGWLSALLYRQSKGMPAGEVDMQALQKTFRNPCPNQPPDETPPKTTGFPVAECAPIRFVRRYSNYLTPRLGLSGDTLALISLGVRNFVVMQLLLVTMLVAVFSGLLLLGSEDWVPKDALLAQMISHLNLFGINFNAPGRWLLAPATALLLIALGASLFFQCRWNNPQKKLDDSTWWALLVLIAAMASGIFIALAMEMAANKDAPPGVGWWIAFPPACYFLIWIFAVNPNRLKRSLAGMVGGVIAFTAAILLIINNILPLLKSAPFGHAIAFAPPVAIATFALVITVHLALAGSAISEQNREWWARLGGQGMFLALIWSLAFVFLLYVPPLIIFGWDRAALWLIAGGGLSTILTVVGAYFAQSKDTGGKKSNVLKDVLAKSAPWVFLALMLEFVALIFVHNLPNVNFSRVNVDTPPCQICLSCPEVNKPCTALMQQSNVTIGDAIDVYLKSLDKVVMVQQPSVIFVVSVLLFAFLLIFVDLNLFSAHSFYTNRLARTFMGASQTERRPNPFTGFDPRDDLKLSELAGQRPIHLINATLNMTGGEDLAWQTRRGASFVFTPCYSGYAARDSEGKCSGGFRPTNQYGGRLSLTTTVAVSGAAASPNMGFHTSVSVAALLTAFNLRLARWCPNPEKDQWDRNSPRSSAAPLFAELLGSTNAKNSWVNLSDGGHFENLGIYELIRRKAKLILVTDIGADPEYRFDDLAMAVRKIWVDFGVRVEIAEDDLDAIRPRTKKQNCKSKPCFSRNHWAFGRVCYPDPDDIPGYLIYVKSSITANAPVDIRQYYDAHRDFPHESTADQWFDEDQFEAYRHLGQIIAENLLDELFPEIEKGHVGKVSACELIENLYDKLEERFEERKGKSTSPYLEALKPTTQGDQP